MSGNFTTFPIPYELTTDLVALGGPPATGDLIDMVDISDPTQSPQGSTKSMTVGDLFTTPAFTGGVTITGTLTMLTDQIIGSKETLTGAGSTPLFLENTGVGAGNKGLLEFHHGTGGGAVVCGIIASDGSNNLTFLRADGTNALTIDRASGATSVLLSLAVTGDATIISGGVVISSIGKALSYRSGSNAKVGSAVLAAGTVTVANTSVTANSKIFAMHTTVGGSVGTLSIGTVTPGVSFIINSSNAGDISTVTYWILETT